MNMYYYRARYFDPLLGTFISEDPIQFEAGDHNLYRYVLNQALTSVDPSGLIQNTVERKTVQKNTTGSSKLKAQLHHVISKKVHDALKNFTKIKINKNSKGLLVRAKDNAAHRGYQKWHRDLDDEIVRWITLNPKISEAAFIAYLVARYSKLDLLLRFPGGLTP